MVAGSILLGGCIRTLSQPANSYWVSSDSSQYSPVARFRVSTTIDGSVVSVRIDSATLGVPGEPVRDAPPLMSNLYIRAFVAVPDSNTFTAVEQARGHHAPDRRAWRPLSISDSVALVDQLRYGERRVVNDAALVLHDLPGASAEPLWLVFRISGNTIELRAPLVAGEVLRRRDLPGGVQVYACGDRDLFGRLDAVRGAALKRAYGLAC